VNKPALTSNSIPFPDCYWVLSERFLAGPFPGADEEKETRRKLVRLLQYGITALVDLTEEDQHLPYQSYLREEARVIGRQISYLRMAIKDFSVPTVKEMIRILDTIDQYLMDGEKVYLHCLGGIGRTGMVVGCFLARHGKDGKAALQKVAELRQSVLSGSRSPETDEQISFVLNWQTGK